jgi:hypothetical protein
VSLACAGAHFVARFDDGQVRYNLEATNTGQGGVSAPPDEFYRQEYNIPQKALDCGSDLRAVRPRELLGLFVGLRARHYENTGKFAEAEADYLLARWLFPTNRHLHVGQVQSTVQCAIDLFEPQEKGHPVELAEWLQQLVTMKGWRPGGGPRPVAAHEAPLLRENAFDPCVPWREYHITMESWR